MRAGDARSGPGMTRQGPGTTGLVNFLQSVTFAVVKMARHILLIVLTLIPLGVSAQNHVRRAMERARERQEAMARAQVASEQGKGSGGNMRMVVKDGDTTYLDRLPAVYILSRSKRTTDKQWRQYYKLVWRFARVYPYAQASRVLKEEIDSTLNAEHYGAFRKGRYISAIQKDLFRDFEGALRQAHRPGNRRSALRHHQELQERRCGHLLAGRRQNVRKRPQVFL